MNRADAKQDPSKSFRSANVCTEVVGYGFKMPVRRAITKADPEADPFHERNTNVARRQLHVLGGLFEFESNDRRLLKLAEAAYAGLPGHRLRRPTPRFHLRLQLVPGRTFPTMHGP